MKTGTATTRRRLLAVLIAPRVAGGRRCAAGRTISDRRVGPVRGQRSGEDGRFGRQVDGRLPGFTPRDQPGDDRGLAAAGRAGVGRIAEGPFRGESQGRIGSARAFATADRSFDSVLAADQRPAGDRFDAGGAGRPPVDAGPPPGPAQSSVRQRSPTGAVSRRLLVAGQGSALDLAVWFRPGRRRVCPAVG